MASTILPISQTQTLAPVTDVLDLLFENDGVLNKDNEDGIQSITSFTNTPDFSMLGNDLGEFLGITDSLAENILEPNLLLNTPDTDIIQSAFTDIDSLSNSPTSTSETIANHELDHNYTSQRLPSPSCSSSSITESDEQFSPRSDTTTTSGDMSPGVTQQCSPLGMGIEDMDIKTCLFEDKDLLNILTTDSALSVNLDMDDGSNPDGQFTELDAFLQTCKDENDEPMISDDRLGSGLPFTLNDCNPNVTQQTSKFPELCLSDEEKSLLAKEGVVLPTNMPLTKEEERALKAVRRKIRNKISAKESRKRKQGYVEGLEKRVKAATAQNLQLQKKVDSLEKQNVTLLSQLKKLQNMISSSSNKPAQTGTCIMVLLLSFALLVVPNFNPFSNDTPPIPGADKHIRVSGNSRSLLEEADSTSTAQDAKFWATPDPKQAVQYRADSGPTPIHFNEPVDTEPMIASVDENLNDTSSVADQKASQNVSETQNDETQNNETVSIESKETIVKSNSNDLKYKPSNEKIDERVIVNIDDQAVQSDDL